MRTHKMKILAWLMTGRSITPLEAIRYLGCYRLGARICELRREGFNDEGEPDLLGLEPAESSGLLAELLHRFAFLDLVE